MNQKKIAFEAGVSVSTVSKAFSNSGDISEKTRNKIFEISKKYGCYNKYIKNKFPKMVIGVICHEVNSEFYARCIDILKQNVENNNGIMLIAQDDFDEEKRIELVDYYTHLNVDGVISFGSLHGKENNLDLPFVSIGTDIKIDWENSILDAIKYLSSLNHKNIAFVGEKLTESKMKIFSDCIGRLHMPLMVENLVVAPGRFEQAGIYGADKLIETECTAVICGYDNIAFGLINRLNELGYKVPQDFAVIGMDNIRASNYSRESLTTISVDIDKLCETAVDLVFKKIKNKYYIYDGRGITTKLVIRGSTQIV